MMLRILSFIIMCTLLFVFKFNRAGEPSPSTRNINAGRRQLDFFRIIACAFISTWGSSVPDSKTTFAVHRDVEGKVTSILLPSFRPAPFRQIGFPARKAVVIGGI